MKRIMTVGTSTSWCSLVAGALLVASLSGCGGDPDGSSAVDLAKARVSAAEEDLADAQADLTDASAEFCGASEDYILALDRYGDVLTQTAVTVGDVNDAGSDLEEPREDAMSGAEAAVAAQQAVVDAEQELAEAKADLKAAKNPDSTTAPAPTASSSPTPLAPKASVSRVERAEQEMKATQKGINEDTPLAQASQQFNAAVVALEMAWLRLFADAGCLTDEQQVQAEAAVRSRPRCATPATTTVTWTGSTGRRPSRPSRPSRRRTACRAPGRSTGPPRRHSRTTWTPRAGPSRSRS